MIDKNIDIKLLEFEIFSYKNRKELGISGEIIEHEKYINNIIKLDNLIKKKEIASKEKGVFTPYDTGKIRGKNI